MASTRSTQLVIQGAPLDPSFEGDLQELFDHLLERMRIVAPFGVTTFVIGTQVPATDQGPLFLETATGTSLWVWSDSAKTYVPIDLTPSESTQIAIQQNQPTDTNVLLWVQTNSSNVPQTLWAKSGSDWYDLFNARGSTAGRPSNPAEGTRYFDTDINVELIYERSAWRTLSGSPGDVKFVTHATLSEAIRHNPGWIEASTTSSLGASIRGRSLAAAHKDQGTSPVQDNPAVSGVATQVAAREHFGSEEVTLANNQTPGWPETHWHGVGEFEGGNDDAWFNTNNNYRDEGFTYDRDYYQQHINGDGSTFLARTHPKDSVATAFNGIVTTPPVQESDSYDQPTVSAHENRGPRTALWCLVKE
jgi:hypothetical protein